MKKCQTMPTVYILWHVRPGEDDADDSNAKLIGVFDSKENAQSAIARLLNKPGFKDYPEHFHINDYELNEMHWTSGFGDP